MKKLNWVESLVFLIINNNCDKGNSYVCLGGCFRRISQVLRGSLKHISRVFLEGLKCIGVRLQGGFIMFLSKIVYFYVLKSNQLCMQTQLERNTLGTPMALPLHTPKIH